MFHVDSEVGRLRQVVLHRPELELKRLTPDNASELLFDEVLWAERAQAEHDEFAEALLARGVAVHYYGDLLTQTLEISAGPELHPGPGLRLPAERAAGLRGAAGRGGRAPVPGAGSRP